MPQLKEVNNSKSTCLGVYYTSWKTETYYFGYRLCLLVFLFLASLAHRHCLSGFFLGSILIPQKRIYNEAQDMPKASLEESKTRLACRTFKPLTGRLGKSQFQQLAFYCRYVFASQILKAWYQEKIEKLIGMSSILRRRKRKKLAFLKGKR